MEDWPITMAERITSLNSFTVYIIEEAELHGISGSCPDCEVATLFSETRTKVALIGWLHGSESSGWM